MPEMDGFEVIRRIEAGCAGRRDHRDAGLGGAALAARLGPGDGSRPLLDQARPAVEAAGRLPPGAERCRPATPRRSRRPRRRAAGRGRCGSCWSMITRSTRGSPRLLEHQGHVVVVAGDGRAALDRLEGGGLRPGADGCPDAGDGRPRGRRGHPRREARPGDTSRSSR